MTQIALGIAVALQWKDEGKCVFCGEKAHENKKEDEITPTGWTRQKIGGNFVDRKKELYPPDKSYRTEGHHCVAFSSFIRTPKKDPRDYIAPLNFYLQKKDYDPNNGNNVIDCN